MVKARVFGPVLSKAEPTGMQSVAVANILTSVLRSEIFSIDLEIMYHVQKGYGVLIARGLIMFYAACCAVKLPQICYWGFAGSTQGE